MDQPVGFARFGGGEKSSAQNPFAVGGKSDRHRVVHAACEHRLDPAAIGARPENMRRARDEWRLAWPFVSLFREGPFAPIKPTVRSQIRPMQITSATCERLALEPFLPFLGDSVAVGIGQFPDAGRSR